MTYRVVFRAIQRRPLVIAIYDPKWFMEVSRILANRGVSYSVYSTVFQIPYYSVFYTDYQLFVEQVASRRDILVFYDPDHSCRLLEEAILATRMKQKYNELVIGVDPGRKPYAIVLGDEEVLEYGYVDQSAIAEFIEKCIVCYPHENAVVRVGGGANGWLIALKIKEKLGIPVEVVDEVDTTPREYHVSDPLYIYLSETLNIKDKNAYAALKIALRKGITV